LETKLDDNNFNEVITNNTSLIVEKLQLKILFKLLNNHIYDHKKYNFDYYFYAESQLFKLIQEIINNTKIVLIAQYCLNLKLSKSIKQ
jgi:hypothetical protein